MIKNLFRKDLSRINNLFMGHFIDPKVLYTLTFNRVPCISFVGDLEGTKVFDFVWNTYQNQFSGVYQHNYFDHEQREFFFNNTLFVMKHKRIIEIGDNYCQVFFTKHQYEWGKTMIQELSVFRKTEETNKVIGFARNTTMN